MKKKVLLVMNDETKFALLNKYLTALNYSKNDIYQHTFISDALTVSHGDISIIFADLSVPGADDMSCIQLLKRHFTHVPIIAISDNDDTDTCLNAIEKGRRKHLPMAALTIKFLGKPLQLQRKEKRSLTRSKPF